MRPSLPRCGSRSEDCGFRTYARQAGRGKRGGATDSRPVRRVPSTGPEDGTRRNSRTPEPMTPQRRAPLMGAWARTGWLATTIVLAAMLLVSSWLNYRAAHDAVSTLNTGQAEIMSTALRSASTPGSSPADTATLNAVLESQREAGLRYIALIDPDGKTIASV